MRLYKIRDWNKHYENSRTRTMAVMRWVPVPNKHDGGGYIELVSGRDGSAMLGAWVAVLQVASKCTPRGILVRGNGNPHTSASLSAITRLSEDCIEKMLNKASSKDIGWIEVLENNEVTDYLSPAYQEGDKDVTGACKGTDEEENRIEGNGREGNTYVQKIYEAYPRKVAKAPALIAIAKALSVRGPEWMLERVKLFAKSHAGNLGKYTPHPATWFNGARYDDDETQWQEQKGNHDDHGRNSPVGTSGQQKGRAPQTRYSGGFDEVGPIRIINAEDS